jgi:hypothetical protein
MADKPTPMPTFPPLIASSTSTTALLELAAAKYALGLTGPVHAWPTRTGLPPSEHPIYSLVGRVASAAAHLEHTLDLIIWDLAGIDHHAGACITAQLSGAVPRYRTIIAQLTLKASNDPRYEPFIKQTKYLMNHTHNPQDERNRIVHDPWYLIVDPMPAGLLSLGPNEKLAQFRAMPQKDLNFGITEIDLEKIEETIKAFIGLEAEAFKLRTSIENIAKGTSADTSLEGALSVHLP